MGRMVQGFSGEGSWVATQGMLLVSLGCPSNHPTGNVKITGKKIHSSITIAQYSPFYVNPGACDGTSLVAKVLFWGG